MITYKQAKKIALELNDEINTCHEYDIAYHFLIKMTIVLEIKV